MNQISLKKRIEYFDHLRLLATLAVITIHVSGPYWSVTDVNTRSWLVLNFFESISRWCVPVFFMISGTLFLGSTQGIRQILRKNILHMVTAFVFWSAVYSAINYSKGLLTVPETIREFLYGYYHMWYLYVIAGLYLAVPLLRKITESRETTRYYLLMALLFGCLLPQLAIFTGLRSSELKIIAERMLDQLSFRSVCGYSLYFVLGWYLHNTDISPRARKWIYVLGILGLGATVILSSLESIRQQSSVHTFFEYMTPNVLLTGTAVFVFAKYHFHYGKLSGTAISVLKKLSKYSFGVYLMHPLFYDYLRYNLYFDVLAYDPLISVPLVSLGLMVLCFLICALIHQIPVLKKYIV